jgi:hypothetical protein
MGAPWSRPCCAPSTEYPLHRLACEPRQGAAAKPIASLYEQAKIDHLGCFPELEDELCDFTTAGYVGASRYRADALVWALTELLSVQMPSYGIYEVMRRRAEGLPLFEGSDPNPLQTVDDAARRRIAASQSAFNPLIDRGPPRPPLSPTPQPGSIEFEQRNGGK